MPALHKLRLHPGHVYIGRALAFAGLAADTKVQGLMQFFRSKGVGLSARKQLPEQVGAPAGAVLFLLCGHVGGAHGAAALRQLAADPGPITKFDSVVEAVLLAPVEPGIDIGLPVSGRNPEVFADRTRFDDLAGIEKIVGIP